MVGLSWRVVPSGKKRTSSCFSWIIKITAMLMEFCPESSQRYTSQLFAPLEKMLEENFLPSLQGNSSVTHSDRILYSISG